MVLLHAQLIQSLLLMKILRYVSAARMPSIDVPVFYEAFQDGVLLVTVQQKAFVHDVRAYQARVSLVG